MDALASNSFRPSELKRRRVETDLGPPVLNARACPSTMPHAGGRLFQQYCVDSFTRIEAERIDWVRRNQPMLRCHTLQGLEDLLHVPTPGKVTASSPHTPCPETSDGVSPQGKPATYAPTHATSAQKPFSPSVAAQEIAANVGISERFPNLGNLWFYQQAILAALASSTNVTSTQWPSPNTAARNQICS